MVKKYIHSHPIFSPSDAKIFSKENTWKILDILQEAGSKGLTEKEVQEKFMRLQDPILRVVWI